MIYVAMIRFLSSSEQTERKEKKSTKKWGGWVDKGTAHQVAAYSYHRLEKTAKKNRILGKRLLASPYTKPWEERKEGGQGNKRIGMKEN